MLSFNLFLISSLVLTSAQIHEQVETPALAFEDDVQKAVEDVELNITSEESLRWLNDHGSFDTDALKSNQNLSLIVSYHLDNLGKNHTNRNPSSHEISLGREEQELQTQKNDHNLGTQCSYESDCPDPNSQCCTESDDCEVVGECYCNDGYTDNGSGTCVGSSYKMVTTVALVTSLILISAVLIAFLCYVMTYVNMRCHRRVTSAASSIVEDPEEIDEPPTYSEVQSMEEKPPSYQEYVKWVNRIKERQGKSNPSYSPPIYHMQMSLEAAPSPSLDRQVSQASVFSMASTTSLSGVILSPAAWVQPSDGAMLEEVTVTTTRQDSVLSTISEDSTMEEQSNDSPQSRISITR